MFRTNDWFSFLSAKKNGGTCIDNEGTSKFNCTCTPRFFDERCETDRCDFYECQNGGTCIVDLINNIPTPRCECPKTHHGATCHLLACSVPCYNGGVCDGDSCHCSQENGIAKYHGESCHVPGSDPCAGNPCQNDGSCTSIIQAINNIQVCFINILTNFYLYGRNQILVQKVIEGDLSCGGLCMKT